MAGGAAADARMRLVDHHHLRAGAQEVVASAVALDEVEADDGERIGVEHADRVGQIPLQSRRAGGGHRHGGERKLVLKFAGPLVDQVRRAQYGEAFDLAPIQELADDHASLDSLADADVISDQEAHGLVPERHEQRRQLIGARLEAETPGAPERPGPSPQRKSQSVTEELRGLTTAGAVGCGCGERSPRDWLNF